MQLTHAHHTPATHDKEIILICDHISSPANAGSIFRLADAFGVKEIIFCGMSPDISSSRLRKTARNTERIVPFRESENTITALKDLYREGFTSVALEITSDSAAINAIDFSALTKIALVVGAERIGVSQETLDICHKIAHIPMYGTNSSMNVAQATGIALYELTRS